MNYFVKESKESVAKNIITNMKFRNSNNDYIFIYDKKKQLKCFGTNH